MLHTEVLAHSKCQPFMGTLFWMVTLRSATGAAACGLPACAPRPDCAPRPRPLPLPAGLPALAGPPFLPVLCSGS